jgi:Peptidase inhibitor family I36
MSMKRQVAFLLLLATCAGLGVGATPARAEDPNSCARGYVCLWGENSYTGCKYVTANDLSSYPSRRWQTSACRASSINNGVNSLTNRGSRCAIAFYDGSSYVGPAIYFHSRWAHGYNYQDPALSNGGGLGFNGGNARQNWQDRISSHNFCP